MHMKEIWLIHLPVGIPKEQTALRLVDSCATHYAV